MRIPIFFAICLLPAALVIAQTTAPTTQAGVTPEAQKVLGEVRAAYAQLKTLTMAGTLSIDLDVGGQTEAHSVDFTAAYQAPDRFRHEIKDDLLLGATGKEFYAWQPGQGRYFHQDEGAAAGRVTLAQLPPPVGRALTAQNPSLAMTLSEDAGKLLISSAPSVQRDEDVKLDGRDYQALEIRTANSVAVALIDPRTHLLRRLSVDGSAGLAKRRGMQDVKKDMLVFDYATSDAATVPAAAQFAFVPPPQARDAAPSGGDEETAAATTLEGKAAPALSLADLAGKTVTLADLKGSVVVLDFWATWCGPCVESLPHLDKLYQDKKDQGLQVFAVNLREDPGTVKAFVQKLQLHMPVLLDTAQTNVAETFLVTGIPQTVVIGKDGKVTKVLVGYDPENGEATLRAAVEAAMGQ